MVAKHQNRVEEYGLLSTRLRRRSIFANIGVNRSTIDFLNRLRKAVERGLERIDFRLRQLRDGALTAASCGGFCTKEVPVL